MAKKKKLVDGKEITNHKKNEDHQEIPFLSQITNSDLNKSTSSIRSDIDYPDHQVLSHSFLKRVKQILMWMFGDFTEFINTPHTILLIALYIIVLTYVAFFRDSSDSLSNTRWGLGIGCLFFIVYGALHFPSDPLIMRPHPVVWKITHAIGILYCCLMIYLLILPVDQARNFLKLFDPELGTEIFLRPYATDCRVFTPEKPFIMQNIWDNLNDVYILAHFLGFVGKALIVRDWTILWIWSIIFEVLEVTFQAGLPNFNECWWDHLILDVFGCNFAGIAVGMWIVKLLQSKKYDFLRRDKPSKSSSKLMKFLCRFTPLSFTTYNWNLYSSFKRWLQTLIYISFCSIAEINAFFLKHCLWLQPPHYLNICRLFIFAGMGFPATREYYEYISNPKVKQLGRNAWLIVTAIVVELLISAKFLVPMISDDLKQTDSFVVNCWILFITLLVLWASLIIFGGGGTSIPLGKSDPEKYEKELYLFGFKVPQKLFFVLLPIPLASILAWDIYQKEYVRFH